MTCIDDLMEFRQDGNRPERPQLQALRCTAGERQPRAALSAVPARGPARVAGGSPPEVPPGFWDDGQLRDALIRERHIGHVVRRYRKHPFHGPRPIPQEVAARWLNISQAQLARIERGIP